MKASLVCTSAFIGLLLMCSSALAHSSGTDASGCHTKKKTGEYHCNGEPTPLVKAAKTEAKTSAKTAAKSSAGGIVCSSDVYNCPNFSTHAEAQRTFDECSKITGRDVHRLDGDKDGDACEDLP